MSDLVGNPEDRFSRVEAQLYYTDLIYLDAISKGCPERYIHVISHATPLGNSSQYRFSKMLPKYSFLNIIECSQLLNTHFNVSQTNNLFGNEVCLLAPM